jgi:hypothetical protein
MLRNIGLHVQLLIAIMLYSGSTALAMDSSEADLDFAEPPLGSSWQRIPQGAPGPNCYVYAGSFDCEFVDQNGLRYLVFGTEVIRKEVDKAGARKDLVVPFGLHFGDSAARIREQLEGVYPVKLNYQTLAPGQSYAAELSTGLSLKNEIGVTFGLYFLFDDSDRLTAVGVTVGEPG